MTRSHSDPMKAERTVPLHVRVLGSTRVSPSFQRVTVGGGEIAHFDSRGFDQWFRLFLPPAHTGELRLPDRDGWAGYAKLLTMPKAVRPDMRNYTVRAVRGEGDTREIDIDFVLHAAPETGEIEGRAAQWALTCMPGDALGLLDEGAGFAPRTDDAWLLLVADETALPAVAGICASLPSDAHGVAIIEVPRRDDVVEFTAPAGIEVRWRPRTADAATGHSRIGSLAYAEARSLDIPASGVHAFAAGEAALATGIRRLLVNERGVGKADVNFCGYWRLPKGAPAIDDSTIRHRQEAP